MEQILNKIPPPFRLVTAMQNYPTSRMEKWLSNVLSPVAAKYCASEYLVDNKDFLNRVDNNKHMLTSSGVLLFSIDVKTLYPSIQIPILMEALQDDLDSSSDYSDIRKTCILNIAEFCLNNAAVEFRGEWFKASLGIITGGSASVPFANIFMRFVTKDFKSECLLFWVRFIDDVFGSLRGTLRSFTVLLAALNSHLAPYGIVFEVEKNNPPGSRVNFLDVTVDKSGGLLKTCVYHKPTDTRRYLHRTSFHAHHTFKGVVLSQMRRLAMIDSDSDKLKADLTTIGKDFTKVSYDNKLVSDAMETVLALNRTDLLLRNQSDSDADIVPFVTNYSVMYGDLKDILSSFKDDFTTLLGDKRVVLAARKNSSTRSLLFQQRKFATLSAPILHSQRCESARCETCRLMSDESEFTLEGVTIKANKSANCKSKNSIYLAVCTIYSDFYLGRTQQALHLRVNGHRDKFTPISYKLSALAHHIRVDHPDKFALKVDNFYFSILHTFQNGNSLDKMEGSLVKATRALVLRLNRYKPPRSR